jgi:hypothetical protein
MRKDEQHPGRDTAEDREPGVAEGGRGTAATRDAVPVVPMRAAEDDPRAWGDREDDHDQWLRDQRPPHWD